MPGTDWIGPTPNRRAGGMSEQRGLVLHIQDGTEAGSEAWFMNPESQASAHFLNPKSGNLRQLVDTDDRAWTQAAGNAFWVSVENEGRGGDALTASQIENCARLLAWLHQAYDVPLQLTDDPNGRGLGWHGMGGSAWGGHYDCPGKAVLAQRGQILARAQQLINPTPEEDPVPYSLADIAAAVVRQPVAQMYTPDNKVRPGVSASVSDYLGGLLNSLNAQGAQLAALTAALDQLTKALAGQLGADPDALVAQVRQAVDESVKGALAAGINVHVDVTAPKES